MVTRCSRQTVAVELMEFGFFTLRGDIMELEKIGDGGWIYYDRKLLATELLSLFL